MDKIVDKIKMSKRKYALIGAPGTGRLTKKIIISYDDFREKLLANGPEIRGNYIKAVEQDSYILNLAIKNADFELINGIINYYATKHSAFDSNPEYSPSEIAKNRLAEFRKYIKLFKNPDLFCHGDVIRFLEGIASLLQLVINANKHNLVRKLIIRGADVNFIPRQGQPLLHHAVYQQNPQIVKLLLENGADPNAKDNSGESVFFRAVRQNDFEIAKCLIEAGANVNEPSNEFSPLQWAISRRNHEMADFIIQNGGDVHSLACGKTPMHYAVDVENDDLIHLLVKNKVDINAITSVELAETALGLAIKKHNLNLIKTVISVGADVNLFCRYVTPLQFAIIKSDYNTYRIMECLISNGAEVNANGSPESKYFGQKPLHIAVEKNIGHVVPLLIKNNADIDATTEHGKTALGIAILNQNFEIVETLVDADVNVNKFAVGSAPLSWAVSIENLKMIEYFLECGADVNVLNADQPSQILNVNSRFFTAIMKMIKNNIIKVRAAELEVSEANLKAISKPELDDFYGKCCKEVALMKASNLGTSNLTYFDVLHNSIHTVATRTKHIPDELIYNLESLELKFPSYARILNHRLKKIVERKKLLEKSSRIISDIFLGKLPDTFTRQIFWYLNNRRLKVLTSLEGEEN